MQYNKIIEELLNKAKNIDEEYLIEKHTKLFNQQGGNNTKKRKYTKLKKKTNKNYNKKKNMSKFNKNNKTKTKKNKS